MRLGFALALVTAMPLSAVAQAAPAPDGDIRKGFATYVEAMNKHDAAGAAAFFTSDADQIVIDGPLVSGRDAIRDGLKAMFPTWPAGRRFALSAPKIHFLTPDVALVENTATFSDGSPSNRGQSVMVRQKGKWLVASLRIYPAEAKAK